MTGKKARKRRPPSPRTSGAKKRLDADKADPFRLYEASVQNTEGTIELIDAVFESQRGQRPMTLREDFCGTAKLCADWVRSDPKRKAVGVDIDPPTLAWAQKHNIDPLGPAAKRVRLALSDVRKGTRQRFDTIAAFNFSYWIFRERAVLKAYFEKARQALKENGLFIIDLHGGPDAQYVLEEETDLDGFSYVWDQESFDPINNRVQCAIHFCFPDGSKIERAFTYDWRVWSLPELRDLLLEVGFSRVDAWWDGLDDVVRPCDSAENLISWIAYLCAWR